jgi:hypothetical protein
LDVPGAGRERVERSQHGRAGAIDRGFDLSEQLVVGYRRGNGPRNGGVAATRSQACVWTRAGRELMREVLGKHTDQERNGNRACRGNPAANATHRWPSHVLRVSDGKGDHTCRPAEMIHLLHDARVLAREPFGREGFVSLVDYTRADVSECRDQGETSALAPYAAAEMWFVNRYPRIAQADFD